MSMSPKFVGDNFERILNKSCKSSFFEFEEFKCPCSCRAFPLWFAVAKGDLDIVKSFLRKTLESGNKKMVTFIRFEEQVDKMIELARKNNFEHVAAYLEFAKKKLA